MGQPAVLKGGWIHKVEEPDERRLMDISIKTFHRFKSYCERYCDGDCYDDLFNKIMDDAEQHKTNCL